MRSERLRRVPSGPLSAKVREQAASAHLKAQLHAGINGSHVLELTTEGVLGYLRVHRSQFEELRRALDAAEARVDELDDQPDPLFARPPERLVF